MKRIGIIIILLFSLNLIIGASLAAAMTVLTEAELKSKIMNNEISLLYIINGEIGGLQMNKYGLVADDIVVHGHYQKIPEDIMKLGKEHDVKIEIAQGSGSRQDIFSALSIFIVWKIFYVIIYVGIFVLLILLNRKASKILNILTRNKE